jgi:hypothetical protein
MPKPSTQPGKGKILNRTRSKPTVGAKWTDKNVHNHPKRLLKEKGGPEYEALCEHLRNIARTKAGRKPGIPDGWGGQSEQLAQERARVKKKAERKVQQMIDQGLLPADDKIAERAVQVLLEIAEGPDAASTKTSAAKALLEFTKQKPVNKLEVKAVAEEWLASLDDSESTEDTEETEG